jgi:hypothetical protein
MTERLLALVADLERRGARVERRHGSAGASWLAVALAPPDARGSVRFGGVSDGAADSFLGGRREGGLP